MKKGPYETLDEYLDDLDAIKEKIADETAPLTVQQRIEYFAGARERLEKKVGRKVRLRPAIPPERHRKASKRTRKSSA